MTEESDRPLTKDQAPYPYASVNGDFYSKETLDEAWRDLHRKAQLWQSGLDAPSAAEKFAYFVLKQITFRQPELTPGARSEVARAFETERGPMTQKLFSASMDSDSGETVEFGIIAADDEEALRLFRETVVGTHVLEEEIEAAIEMGAAMRVRTFRVFDTGCTAEQLPSRLIPWEEIGVREHELRIQDEEDSPTP